MLGDNRRTRARCGGCTAVFIPWQPHDVCATEVPNSLIAPGTNPGAMKLQMAHFEFSFFRGWKQGETKIWKNENTKPIIMLTYGQSLRPWMTYDMDDLYTKLLAFFNSSFFRFFVFSLLPHEKTKIRNEPFGASYGASTQSVHGLPACRVSHVRGNRMGWILFTAHVVSRTREVNKGVYTQLQRVTTSLAVSFAVTWFATVQQVIFSNPVPKLHSQDERNWLI